MVVMQEKSFTLRLQEHMYWIDTAFKIMIKSIFIKVTQTKCLARSFRPKGSWILLRFGILQF